MTLTETIRAKVTAARKAKDDTTKSILVVVLGEIEPIEQSKGTALSDDEVVKIIKKLHDSNSETSSKTSDDAVKQKLEAENAVLAQFIPEVASYDETQGELLNSDGPEVEQIGSAENEGKAMGIAMKFFKKLDGKAFGKPVDSKVVAKVVKDFRENA